MTIINTSITKVDEATWELPGISLRASDQVSSTRLISFTILKCLSKVLSLNFVAT